MLVASFGKGQGYCGCNAAYLPNIPAPLQAHAPHILRHDGALFSSRLRCAAGADWPTPRVVPDGQRYHMHKAEPGRYTPVRRRISTVCRPHLSYLGRLAGSASGTYLAITTRPASNRKHPAFATYLRGRSGRDAARRACERHTGFAGPGARHAACQPRARTKLAAYAFAYPATAHVYARTDLNPNLPARHIANKSSPNGCTTNRSQHCLAHRKSVAQA